MMPLADYMASDAYEAIETVSNADEQSFAMLVLALQDEPMSIIIFGNTRLENTVALNEVEVLALRGVNLRETPSVTAPVVGSLLQGRTYAAIGRLDDNTWLRIRLETGQIAWVSAQFLTSEIGFAKLSAVSPNSPAYLPMQAFDLQTVDDCSGLLLIAPENDKHYEITVNDLVIRFNGAAVVSITENILRVTSLAAELTVQAYGFEQNATANEMLSVPLNDSGMILGIPSEAEDYEGLILDYELFVSESAD
jgi:uncharacterized protein YgiM (DUF1202 family)